MADYIGGTNEKKEFNHHHLSCVGVSGTSPRLYSTSSSSGTRTIANPGTGTDHSSITRTITDHGPITRTVTDCGTFTSTAVRAKDTRSHCRRTANLGHLPGRSGHDRPHQQDH
ncbi:hypothetical protein ACFLV1_02035 [Chloroflexota bacterium]